MKKIYENWLFGQFRKRIIVGENVEKVIRICCDGILKYMIKKEMVKGSFNYVSKEVDTFLHVTFEFKQKEDEKT